MTAVPVEELFAVVPTPLGAVSIRVAGGVGVTIRVDPIPTPPLPDGMAVDGVMLVQVCAAAGVRPDVPLAVSIAAGLKADPESGEWLDSVSYSGSGGTIQVAVRDNEWLENSGIVAAPTTYERHGLIQRVEKAPVETVLHISVAWRAATGGLELTDASTWFAADLALPG